MMDVKLITDMDKLGLMDYLSGGNHELFHSNLLAYIGKIYPKLFLQLMEINPKEYPALENFDPKNLRREYCNFDISITGSDDKFLLVVENKMKSFPNKKQLEKYEEKVNKKNGTDHECCFRLLSLTDVKDRKEFEPWKIITYSQLKENLEYYCLKDNYAIDYLETQLPDGEKKYFSNLLKDYVNYINKLNDILDPDEKKKEVKTGSFSLLRYNEEKDKDNKWLHLMQRKLRFEAMKSLIEEQVRKIIEKEIKKENKDISRIFHSVSFDAGVTRATPFMEITVAFDKDTGKLVKNPTISQAENEIFYWVQIYQGEVQRGFTLALNDELSKEFKTGTNKKENKDSGNKGGSLDDEEIGESTENVEPIKFDRQDYIKKIWAACKEIPVYKTIATDIFAENFCHDCFVPIPEKRKRLRAYLYKDFAMVFIPTTIAETSEISKVVKEISDEITYILKS